MFYATDFADQLENIILPALKAGFMVLADRYIYTLMARDMVRGMDEAWLKNLYGIALVPDAVFYLSVEPEELVQRNFAKNATLDYWESGMDLGLSRDMFDSFLKYQTAMQMAFRQLQKTYGFDIVDGNRSVDSVTKELRKKIGALLAGLKIKCPARWSPATAEDSRRVRWSGRRLARRTFHQFFKLLPLVRRELLADLLPRILHHLAHLRGIVRPDRVVEFLPVGDDFFNLLALFRREQQFVIQAVRRIALLQISGRRGLPDYWSRCRRDCWCAAKPQSASASAGGANFWNACGRRN